MKDLLTAYFGRLGYNGPSTSSLGVLRQLQSLHPAIIPFEALDPFLARPVPLDPPAIAAKLLGSRRGGYCHEQNSLFHDVLAALGFRVAAIGGRVVWMDPTRDAPMTHRVTLVDLPEGRFIADVGFGGQTPTAPLRLEPGLVQPTAQGTFRIGLSGETYETQMRVMDRWEPMYRYRLEPLTPVDFEVANWFTSTHPRSRFTQNLIAARVVGDKRMNLFNTTLTIREPDGQAQERPVADAADLARILDETMAIDPPVPAGIIWSRLTGDVR